MSYSSVQLTEANAKYSKYGNLWGNGPDWFEVWFFKTSTPAVAPVPSPSQVGSAATSGNGTSRKNHHLVESNGNLLLVFCPEINDSNSKKKTKT